MASSWSSTERALVLVVELSACAMSGCGAWIVRRDHGATASTVPPAPMPPSPRAKATGSLWRDDVSANYLFADTRARFAGDLLTIVITEDDSGSKEADTSSKTDTSVFASIEQFFGFPQQLQKHQPNIDPTQLISASSKRTFDGEGSTNRKGKLTARMTAVVKAISPTGNLFVEGDKIVSVNKEDQHIVVHGWVRPEDIDADNQVLSTRLADARIDYYGVGVLGVKQRPGWGYWLMDFLWPF